jgi:hypothetical protein
VLFFVLPKRGCVFKALTEKERLVNEFLIA